MKKVIVPFVFLVVLSIMMFTVFTKADTIMIKDEDALRIGEEKYLKFLWMVDGAFNSERLNNDFTVNGKKLSDEDKIFSCKYSLKNEKECIGNNFENEFKSLFNSSIKYDDVYSDHTIYKWIRYQDGEYIFNNIDNCSINRMGLKHKLKIKNISKDTLTFEVSFYNDYSNVEYKREFILILEDNTWKISKAYYYDLCRIKYNVE